MLGVPLPYSHLNTFSRQLAASVHIDQLTRLLYSARCEWIGGQALDYEILTPSQKALYRSEVELLIKGKA